MAVSVRGMSIPTSLPASDPELIAVMAAQIQAALAPLTGADWSTPARDLEWTCRESAVHLGDSLFAQAAQLVAGPLHDWVPAEVRTEAVEPAQLLRVIDACAGLLRVAAAAARPELRAWHPCGIADPSGWIAMGLAEGLVHTWDITATLGSDWSPPRDLAAQAIARLFPNAPAGDPSDVLLWCSGRIALPDRPRQGADWRWHTSVPGEAATAATAAATAATAATA
jgi:uncharacterized protein (TIGR03083 family)